MKVYIVQEVWQEGSMIIAVFNDNNRAEAYKTACEAINKGQGYSIEEHEVLA